MAPKSYSLTGGQGNFENSTFVGAYNKYPKNRTQRLAAPEAVNTEPTVDNTTELAELGDQLGGLVGRLAGRGGLDAEVLGALHTLYETKLPPSINKRPSKGDLALYNEAAHTAASEYVDVYVHEPDMVFDTDADRQKYALDLQRDIATYLRYGAAARNDVEEAVDQYRTLAPRPSHNHTTSPKAQASKGVALMGGGGASTFKLPSWHKRNADASTDTDGDKDARPNIFRRAHDRMMIDTGIAMSVIANRISDSKMQRVDETDEQFERRMLRNGKRARNVLMGAVVVYAASRLAPGLEFFHGNNGNNVTQHSDAITDVVVTKPSTGPSVAPTEALPGGTGGGHAISEEQGYTHTETVGGAGGGHAISEEQDYARGTTQEQTGAVGGGHAIAEDQSYADTEAGGVGGGHAISEDEGYARTETGGAVGGGHEFIEKSPEPTPRKQVVQTAVGGHEFVENTPDTTDQVTVTRTPLDTMEDYLSGEKGSTRFNNKGVDAFKDWANRYTPNGYKVKPGDTIWDLSEQFERHMGKQPSTSSTDAIKDQLVPMLQRAGYADKNGFLNAGDIINFK